MTGTATILRADARALPLPDASVDLIVTSPPYFALRSYQDGGEHYGGQIGAEQTPAEYIAALIDCTREWVRVLKPGGSIFCNLGDKYSSPGGHTDNGASTRLQGRPNLRKQGRADRSTVTFGIPAKSLMMLPERYRIAAVDQLGLIARAVMIWSKPNGLPESVTDRVRRSHEDWVHLTKQPRYFSAVDEIREPHAPGTAARYAAGYKTPSRAVGELGLSDRGIFNGQPQQANPLGKLPGSVWEIPTEPLKVPAELGVDHFAAFPTEWPRRIILGWSPSGICVECGEGRRPLAVTTNHMQRSHKPHRVGLADRHSADGREGDRKVQTAVIAGYSCACPEPTAPTRPAVVVDPFGGTGTTALVAKALGRHGVSFDRSADYCRLARWRTTDPGQLAKAMRVPAPPKQLAGQDALDLFGGAA